jgi:hypothetical protein
MLDLFMVGLFVHEPPQDYVKPAVNLEQHLGLSYEERDRIRRQAEFAYIKSMECLNNAESAISRISDIDVRMVCKHAVQAAIMALAGSSNKERVILGALTVIGRYVDDSIDHVIEAYNYTHDAKFYAAEGDRLQERLWRDA